MIPGRMLHRLGSALCSPDMRERVIDAFVADFQSEWVDATTPRQRAFVTVRAYWSFAAIMAGCLVHDAQHDFAGFARRVLKRVGLVSVWVVTMIAFSWKNGHVDWVDLARRFGWAGAFGAALFISAHRSQHAARRAWAPFFLAVGVAVAVLVLHPINDGHGKTYEWVYMMSLTLAWPFLVRKKRHSIVKSSHRD
jgi:hypothetical protein